MAQPKLIKTITPYICPNCSKEINICLSFLPPGLTWVITKEEMEQNKRRLKDALKVVAFKSKEEKEEVMTWVDTPDCVLGSEDIDDIVRQIAEEQKE